MQDFRAVFCEFLESKGYDASNYRVSSVVYHMTIKDYAKKIHDPIVRAEAMALVDKLYTIKLT